MVVERRGDLRVLAGTPVEASVTFYQGGLVADPGADVTVQVRRANGETFTPAGQVGGEEAGPRTVALSNADTSEIDVLTLSWTSSTLGTLTTTVEVVGDRIFTIEELRNFGGDRVDATQGLHNAARYPNHLVDEARRRVEDGFEEICEVSFIPRLKVATLNGDGRELLLLPGLRVLRLVWVELRNGSTWTALDSTDVEALDLDSGTGILYRHGWGWPGGGRNVRVGYIHGHERVPEEIRRAGMILARTQLIESNVSDRNMSVSSEDGTFRLATAGVTRGSWYGLPLVDSVLARYREHVPGVG